MAENLTQHELNSTSFKSTQEAITTRFEAAHINRLKQLAKCEDLDSSVQNQIKAYLRLQYQDTNTFKIEYVHSGTSPKCRLYARNFRGGQGFKRELRNYVMEGLYRDYDIVNCFPTLLFNLSEVKNIGKCAALESYVNDRSAILESLKMDKHSVLEALNKHYEVPKAEVLKEIHDFIYKKFVPHFETLEEVSDLLKIVRKERNNSNNQKGSFLCKVIQRHENRVLTAMDNYLKEKGYKYNASVLVFDGIQVLQEGGAMPVDLRDMERHIKEETGFDMKVCEKPMEVDLKWLQDLGLEPLSLEPEPEEELEDEKTFLFRQPLYPEDKELDQLAKEVIMFKTQDSVANFLFHLWKDDFYYHGKEWWYFAKHHWQTDDGSYFSTRVLLEFRKIFDKLTEWKSPKQDKLLCKMLKKLNLSIGTHAFYSKVTKTAALYFATKDFIGFHKKLERNLSLLCFKNGVFDLKNQEFRAGKASDYCLLQISYNYREYNPNCKRTKNLEDKIAQIQPIDEKRDYVMKALSASLGCHTTDKLNILQGEGANAKSWLLGLMVEALDVYALSWNTNVLVNDITGESPNPELADGQQKRFIEIQEAKKNKALNMENVKKLTGYDRIRARKLYKDGHSFVIIANLFLSVNELPIITETDNGTWRRMNVITFESTFVENPEQVDVKNHVYLADAEAKKQHGENAPYFMSILLHYYKQFADDGRKLHTPQTVIDDTKRFKERNDVYSAFFDDCCEIEEGERIHVEDLWKACHKWVKNQSGNIQINRRDMLNWFKRLQERDERVIHQDSLQVIKEVCGRKLGKVSTGFKGIRLNKYREVKEEEEEKKPPLKGLFDDQ